MVSQLDATTYLCQEDAVWRIKNQFGSEFVYTNANGNYAIGKHVLKEFRQITNEGVVWDKSERAWRRLRPNETYSGRQVE